MTSKAVKIARSKSALRQQVNNWHKQGLTVGMVPTMGALHHGHLSLIREIQKQVDRVVVSIFVNPKQFGPHEDFDQYPRQETQDIKKLEEVNTDLLYTPQVEEIYPDGFLTTVSVNEITKILCAKSRPGHFDGVTTVVTKLLLQCLPDVALFGEKDYQQYIVLKQMAKDLDIPTKIIGGKLIRDEDGLATSSRNVYLSKSERKIALEIPLTLKQIIMDITVQDLSLEEALEKGKQHLLNSGFNEVQYLEIRHSDNLTLVTGKLTKPSRLLVAVQLGKTRLIDNMVLEPITTPSP